MAPSPYSPGQSFLDSLSPSERKALTAAARERTFPRRSTPMREGNRADYVMVVLDGWVQISVSEDGQSRVIAKRGPGQLIGEVGILRINARSATVTVMDTVRALVLRTGDFAGFLSDHQRVRAIVDDQIDERLTEEPYRWNAFPAKTAAQSLPSGENWTVVHTDIVGFGAHERNDRHRRTVRTSNLLIMRASFGHLWDNCIWTDQGDGLLIIVSPAVPTTSAMERLHRELPEKVRQHNRVHEKPSRIRLRVAADVGPVSHDLVGLTGETIIHTARMLDAPVLRKAVASPSVSLGLIVSSFVYDTAIRHADEWANPCDYDQVEACVKESRIQARMRLFGRPPAVGGPAAA